MSPANEQPSFEERFETLSLVAYRVAFRLLGNRPEAEEVAQEALARAYVRWTVIVGHDEPWIARVASNLAIGIWRRRRPPVAMQEPLQSGEGVDLERLGLVVALRRLPRRQREVVVLRYLADLPEREVAVVMKTSVGSVKQHAHRALARLRVDLSTIAPLEVEDV